jgi:TRAP transporter TAXI family solute receptor
MKLLNIAMGILLAVFMIGAAGAETRITYKSAKSTSSYYQMAVEIAEAMKKGSDGNVIVTVEESQGSVQNVMEAIGRTNNYVFTTPPVLIKLARGGKAMFKDKSNPRFDEVKALFPIPSLTMHFVMSKSSGVTNFGEMEGKTILLGKGSFGAKEGAKYLKLFGLEGKVKLAEVELSNAVPALKNGQIDGFVTAGSFPAPNVIEAAASAGAKVVSLNDEQVKASKRTRLVIPAGTYAGQSEDIITTSLPVVAFTTSDMSNDTAYLLTKTYWENKKSLGEAAKWWNGVSLDMLENILTDIHPGAKKYYQEVGAKLATHH